MRPALTASMFFSFSHFSIYDSSVRPGCMWSDTHVSQGFARREGVIGVGTLLDGGSADLEVYLGRYELDNSHKCVIACPLSVRSGKVSIESPEEAGINRTIDISPGEYRVTVAQSHLSEDEQRIAVYFDRVADALMKSEILVADAGLTPPTVLLETADQAR